MTKDRFIAMLDIMGFKALVKNEGVGRAYSFYQEVDDLAKQYATDGDLLVTYYSDSIMAATKDKSAKCFESLAIFCAQIETYCIERGYAVNGAISYGEITIDIKRNIWIGEPLASAYDLLQKIFFYGIVLDQRAVNQSKDYTLVTCIALNISDFITEMAIPTKDKGWQSLSCVNWFEFVNLNPICHCYQNQIEPLKEHFRALYEKNKDAGRGLYYILNTEILAKQWYDYLGKVNTSDSWGHLIFEDHIPIFTYSIPENESDKC